MTQYINGEVIKVLREKNNMTQSQLAGSIGLSDKAVSKWETGRGLPDITLVEPLARALGVSVGELFAGEQVINRNTSANMNMACIRVCPVCGNIIQSVGDASVSCCGITIPAAEVEEEDEAHKISVEIIEDEYFVTVGHPMTKDHFISFIMYRTSDRTEMVKLYPEGNAQCRFLRRGRGKIFAYCNRHGLYEIRV